MKTKSQKLRFVLLAAISLDGRITNGSEEGSEWTSKEDKSFFQSELDKADAVIMGRKTFDAIKRPLTPRNRVVFSRLSSPPSSPAGGELPKGEGWELRGRLRGGSQLSFNGSSKKLLTLLKEHGWTRVAIVGGTSIYQWFLERNLVDEIYLTVEPVLFGSGKLLTEDSTLPNLNFALHSVHKLNARGTLVLHYKKII